MEYYITDILDKLVGHTNVSCNVSYDDESMENLEELNLIAGWLLDRLKQNAKWYGDYRASANDISIRTYELIDYINKVTKDLLIRKEEKDKETHEKLIY